MSLVTPRAIALAIGSVLPLAVIAQPTTSPSLEARVQQLDQEIRILQRKLEIDKENAVAASATAPVIKADSSGLSISTQDFSFQFKGLIQADGRWFTGDSVPQTDDTFVLRRLRPTFQGTVGSLVAYRLTPEFAGNGATIVDAWVDLKLAPTVTLRAGKQKGPIGLERLQSGAAIAFIERGLPTELAPNREIGVQLQGGIVNNTLQYVVGVYNGTTDGADAGATDNDGRKELALRLFYEPTPGIGFGVAGTHGSKRNVAPRGYATVDRRNGTTFVAETRHEGDATRISPQAYFYRGPVGVLAEYIQSAQELTVLGSGVIEEVTHSAYQVVGSYVLTGEAASYRGVKPSQAFQTGKPGWGAFELVARYGKLELDSDAADLGFIAATGVESIDNLGIGLNWYLTGNVKVAANANQTNFSNYSGPDREKEKSIFTRLQVSF